MSFEKFVPSEKPNYVVFILRNDGPDDVEWCEYHTTPNHKEACEAVQFADSKGYTVKMFDPYVGKEYNANGEEISNVYANIQARIDKLKRENEYLRMASGIKEENDGTEVSG